MKRRIISVLMENQPGALSRVVGLFSQRGYNIDTLNVAPTDDATLSRLTVTVFADESILEQIEKQLHKLIDVLKVSNITESAYVERELAMIKVRAVGEMRDEVKRMADIFRGQIVDVTSNLYTIQLAGTSEKLDSFISAMAEATKVIEVSRSGVVGLARGDKAMKA
ncbi:acetolactate synthase 3 regulatory subunit [Shewanella mangrovi]|uniref:Acetolactate synthase small subunit n=1 Tax=Shewanella mangrovi TaxID=1515746 RepID=A0A094JHN8_9GAMM|nr:acetolactate synthase small subunit [Shewanella mangrovi]KFZ38727.1 acetolactate synthase 3 regulatory subunit [Shewanella mangrovi]